MNLRKSLLYGYMLRVQPKRTPLHFDYEAAQRRALNILGSWCVVAAVLFAAILVVAGR